MSSETVEQSAVGGFRGFLTWLGTYKGLVTATIVYEFFLILFLASFSEPVVAMFGQPLIPIVLDPTMRTARIIMVYHSLAIVFLGAVVFFALAVFDVREKYEPLIKWTILPGFILTSLAGMTFAYILPENWIAHALFIVGLTLVFVSGVLLLLGTWLTKSFPERKREGPYLLGINWAQVSVVLVVICMLISSMLGAGVGAYFGNGFDAILAEDLLRVEHDLFARAVVGHLHVMLALIDCAILLIVWRYVNPEQKGLWYLAGIIIAIPGIVIISIGAWLVPVGYEKAHMVINVGATFALLSALMLTLSGWKRASVQALGDEYESASIGRRVLAVLKDPVRFGLYIQFIWVNFAVTLPGIYVAFNLEDFRSIDFEIERTIAVGHWHVLATLTAIIMLLLAFDYLDVRGIARQIVGWTLVIGSFVAFGFANAYMFHELGVDPNLAFLLIDAGIMLFVAGIAIFCIYMLIQIIKGKTES
ncbi:MAG: hypothetical protein ACTSPE_03545 [Candidatus Thorarchaeota archaeon]